jgi:hypothetical protein
MFISHFGYTFYRQAGGASMSVLREPVERILSLYSYWKNPGRGRPPGDPLPDGLDLEGFLRSTRDDISTNINNAQTWQLSFGLDRRTRARLAGLADVELLDIAIKNVKSLRIVGVAEELHNVMKQLGDYFGETDLGLDFFNRSVDRVRRSEVSDWALQNIKERTKLDQILYGVALQESRSRISKLSAAKHYC